jgi:membrane peptidoglycan carboxypeptidase
MARAYGSFANGGYRVDGSFFGDEPRVVTQIMDESGKVVETNAPAPKQVLTPEEDEVLTQLLEGVVTSGTGRAAALPDRPVAGKTGTTENYGDAWFVGYTPQLVTAVWVGYPNKLVSMAHLFHGGPVVGGTYPALIWKTFMQSALAAMHAEPKYFASPPYLSATGQRVTYRNGLIQADNGLCRDTSIIVYYTGHGPARTANCKRNEVDVPNVVGWTLAAAQARLAEMPLTPQLIYKPASPGQNVERVVRQFPVGGTLSSFDKVTLVLAKPLHGLVPHVVGLPLQTAQKRLARLKLTLSVRFGTGKAGRVVAQAPLAGVAAAPGMTVHLVVARG